MAELNLHPRNLPNRYQQWHYLKPVIFFLGVFFDDRSLVERRLTFFW